MPKKQELAKIRDVNAAPHFKNQLKRRTMDTSNWVRLKTGYDQLDITGSAPIKCWERIGPERVRPLLTTAPKNQRTSCTSNQQALQRPEPKTRLLDTVELPEIERPISTWSLYEIENLLYVPKLNQLLEAEPSLPEESSQEVSIPKHHNPYKQFYQCRPVPNATTLSVEELCKISREFCVLLDTLVTESSMVHLLACGFYITGIAPYKLQKLGGVGVEIQPLVCERPIEYVFNTILDPETWSKAWAKRKWGFGYGRWYCPIRLWGNIEKEYHT